jgi:hypothetical protein
MYARASVALCRAEAALREVEASLWLPDVNGWARPGKAGFVLSVWMVMESMENE